MWVGVQLPERRFGANVPSPNTGEGEEESLLGGKSVNHARLGFTTQRELIGPERQSQSAQVAEGFSKDQLAGVMQAVPDVQLVELIHDTSCALIELLAVVGG